MAVESSHRKLTVQEVTFFLQEEFRRHESDKFCWEKEREVILGNLKYLREAASQHEGVVSMLEKRISMLEDALQRERTSTQRSTFTSPPPTDRLTSHALTDSAAFEESPGASKENEPPPQTFSGRKRFSPGFSPLGRKQRKREEASGQAPASEQPLSSRRKTAQRSLTFGGAEPAAQASGMPWDAQRPTKLPDSPMPVPGAEGGSTGSSTVPLPSATRAASLKNRALSREQRRQKESAVLLGATAAPASEPDQTCNFSADLLDTPRLQDRSLTAVERQIKTSKPIPASKSIPVSKPVPISKPRQSSSVKSFGELPEDGSVVAESILGHVNLLDEDEEGSEDEGDLRPVLAPLRGVMLCSPRYGMSPKSKAMGSLKVNQLARDASKMVLGEDSDSLATSLSTTPTGSPAQLRIAA